MSKSLRVAAAGMLMAALGGAGLVAASPASAASTYTLEIVNGALFTADFCLTAQSYDNNADFEYRCSGDRMAGQRATLTVRRRDRDRIFLDVWVRGGDIARQVTVHNGYNTQYRDHVFNTRKCTTDGITFMWWLTCVDDKNVQKTFYASP
jgi:hypothetical protein